MRHLIGQQPLWWLVIGATLLATLPSWAGGALDLELSARTTNPRQRIGAASRAIASRELGLGDLAMAYNNRAWGWIEFGLYDLALADLDQALELSPGNAWAYINRSLVLVEKGLPMAAVDACNRAADLAPENPWIYVNRGLAWNDLLQFDRALADSNRALALDPDNALAYINRGHAWHEKGNYGQALSDCNRALELAPDHPIVNNSLAYLLATCPMASLRDGKRAVRLAEKAIRLAPHSLMIWDTLAMAYAEAGDLTRAVQTQRQAINLIRTSGTHREQKRLDSYLIHLEELESTRP